MKKYKYALIIFLIILVGIGGITTMSYFNKTKEIPQLESVLESGTDDSNFVQLTKVNDKVWVHTTYYNYNGSRVLSNGLLVLTSKGIVLVDTPWTNDQTKELIKLTKEKFEQDIITTIITHAHIDRIGGISALLDNKTDVISTPLTAQLAEELGYDKPNPSLTSDDTVLEFGDTKLEVYFPGEGHTVDNLVVWLPEDKILFGGCIVKPLESTTMGNTDDANIEDWPNSIQNMIDKFNTAEIVIPSHGDWADKQILTHTLDLLNENAKTI